MGAQALSLDQKTALVIGATHPIGRAIALALADAGADVVVATLLPTQRAQDAVRACAREIETLRRKSSAQIIDTTNESDVDNVVQHTVSTFGQLDILVNAHDVPFAKSVSEVSLAEWRRVLDIHITGVYLACRAAAGPMLAQGKGRIINVVSLLSERGMANGSAYCAAQGGMLNLTRALATEWARSGVTINALGVGWTEGSAFVANEELKKQLERYLPHKRLAQPQEVGGAAVYLASDATGFITGQVLWIEGGALSHV
ncbi:MAG: SDR family NAD(P)-dependent oxidoreductase [Candidatus Binatia bacterium]